MRRGMADDAIGVGQAIGMKVRLLDGGAEEEKKGTQERKHDAPARLRSSILYCSSHK